MGGVFSSYHMLRLLVTGNRRHDLAKGYNRNNLYIPHFCPLIPKYSAICGILDWLEAYFHWLWSVTNHQEHWSMVHNNCNQVIGTYLGILHLQTQPSRQNQRCHIDLSFRPS